MLELSHFLFQIKSISLGRALELLCFYWLPLSPGENLWATTVELEEGVTFPTSRRLAGAVTLVFLPYLSGHGIHSMSELGQGWPQSHYSVTACHACSRAPATWVGAGGGRCLLTTWLTPQEFSLCSSQLGGMRNVDGLPFLGRYHLSFDQEHHCFGHT